MPPGRFSGYHSRKNICWSSDFIFSMKKSRGSVFGWPKLINSKSNLRDISKIHFWGSFEGYYTKIMSFLNVSERYLAFQKKVFMQSTTLTTQLKISRPHPSPIWSLSVSESGEDGCPSWQCESLPAPTGLKLETRSEQT